MNNNTLPAAELVFVAFNIRMVLIIANIPAQIKIKCLGCKFCIFADQPNIFPDLRNPCISVIMQKVAIKISGITLYNMNMAECIQ